MILHHLYLTTLIAMILGGHHVRTSPSGHHVQGQGHGHDHLKSEETEGSVLLRIGDEMVEMLGLSKADMEELQEVSDSAVTPEDWETMREVLARMSEDELEELAEMDHQQLDKFYKEHVEAVERSRRHVNNDDHDHINSEDEQHTVYVGIGDELIKLEGLSENQMEELMEPTDSP